MTATQEKLYNELSTDVINDDDSAAARLYEKYEDLPLVEQLALGFTPVVGETISAYETPIFARETKEAFKEGDYLKTLGKGALTGLAALGSLPLIGMGARGLKGAAKVLSKRLGKDAPIDKETLLLSPPKDGKPYSRLTKAVNDLQQKRGTGAAYISRLKDVSPDEFKSSGLSSLLNKSKNEKISKEELKDFMSMNEVPIEKIDLDTSPDLIKELTNEQNNIYKKIEKLHSKEYKGDMDSLNLSVLKTDSKELADLKKKHYQILNKRLNQFGRTYRYPSLTITGRFDEELEKLVPGPDRNYKETNFQVPGRAYYQEHYKDLRNVIGRVRSADRTDLDGNSTKHIEELQSEYARDKVGKELISEEEYQKKYLDKLSALETEKAPYAEKLNRARERYDRLNLTIAEFPNFSPLQKTRNEEILKDIIEEIKFYENKISPLEKKSFNLMRKYKNILPELPYTKKGNEYKYPLRRMLLEAAQEGKGSLSLTTGQVQFNRYAPNKLYEEELNKLKTKAYIKNNLKDIISDVKQYREAFANSIINKSGQLPAVKKGSADDLLRRQARNEASSKFMNKYKDILSKHNLNEGQLNRLMELESALDRGRIEKIQQFHIDNMFDIDDAIYVANKYDNEYKKYLEKLAKKYNTNVDKTRVDSHLINNIQEYGYFKGKVKGDKAEAYRLIITPEMRTKLLNEGIEKLKEGGRVMKNYYNNYNTQRAI
tara:strand:- start:338 stop:2479 length:2142 start_codon:yes stop_codon:yes gene_type:complete